MSERTYRLLGKHGTFEISATSDNRVRLHEAGFSRSHILDLDEAEWIAIHLRRVVEEIDDRLEP